MWVRPCSSVVAHQLHSRILWTMLWRVYIWHRVRSVSRINLLKKSVRRLMDRTFLKSLLLLKKAKRSITSGKRTSSFRTMHHRKGICSRVSFNWNSMEELEAYREQLKSTFDIIASKCSRSLHSSLSTMRSSSLALKTVTRTIMPMVRRGNRCSWWQLQCPNSPSQTTWAHSRRWAPNWARRECRNHSLR